MAHGSVSSQAESDLILSQITLLLRVTTEPKTLSCILLVFCNCWEIMHAYVLSHFSSIQLFVTLWTVSPPGSSAHGISQTGTLEWVAISFSRGSSDPVAKPGSPALAGRLFTTEPTGKPPYVLHLCPFHSITEGSKI